MIRGRRRVLVRVAEGIEKPLLKVGSRGSQWNSRVARQETSSSYPAGFKDFTAVGALVFDVLARFTTHMTLEPVPPSKPAGCFRHLPSVLNMNSRQQD